MTNLLGHLLLGIALALAGVIPPGLLNMNAAKITMRDGRIRGLVFAIGASFVVSVQASVGLFFAKFLSRKTDVVLYLERFGLLIFILLSVYFFVQAFRRPKMDMNKKRSKRNLFWYGVILSALNVFPIPFYAFVSVYFASEYWFTFEKPYTIGFVVGTSLGTFLMLYLYTYFAGRITLTGDKFVKKMNLSIGLITALIALFTLYKVLQNL
ncbi:MAG: lysine transporter LysE [Flavobacteriaceae bacterium]|nr:lysine transporter LysE [Flavobacteriaceae bacterium]